MRRSYRNRQARPRRRRSPFACAKRRGSIDRAKAVPRIASTLLTVEAILLCGLALLCFGGAPFGIASLCVLSPSMEPTLPVGSLVFIDQRADAESLNVGDIAAFTVGGGQQTVCTHRVFENDAQSRELITKGDANDAADPVPVAYGNVKGKAIGAIPLLGFATQCVSQAPAATLCVVGGFTLLLVFISHASKRRALYKTRIRKGFDHAQTF